MAFSLGKAERFETPPKPDTWLHRYPHSKAGIPCIGALMPKIPHFIQTAVDGKILFNLNTSHPSFVDFKNNERFIGMDEMKLPGFAGKLSEEQHMLYMIPFIIETPPLLVLLHTLDRGSNELYISEHCTMTDVHAFYRDAFEYLQFQASLTDADPTFKARVMEAQKGYTNHCASSKTEFLKDAASIPGAKALAAKKPVADTPLPDLSQHYDPTSVAQFAHLAFCYNRSLISSIELAICCALDLSPKMCAAAELIQLGAGLRPPINEIHESVYEALRAQEQKLISECIDYQKTFVAPVSIPEWLVTTEFLFNNWCLAVMKLDR
jgi:hypothetical protein